jgi:hypothetical protein
MSLLIKINGINEVSVATVPDDTCIYYVSKGDGIAVQWERCGNSSAEDYKRDEHVRKLQQKLFKVETDNDTYQNKIVELENKFNTYYYLIEDLLNKLKAVDIGKSPVKSPAKVGIK